MNIRQATIHHFEVIKNITLSTIKEIYPLYYLQGTVEFFLSHHKDENIFKDIQNGNVFFHVTKEEYPAGTITIQKNEICRLFVLPSFQKQGIGRELLNFAEQQIAHHYKISVLDASLPAQAIYFKRGYIVTETHTIQTPSGEFFSYDVMQKVLL